MSLISYLKNKVNVKRIAVNAECEDKIARFTSAIEEAKSFFDDKNEYIDKEAGENWISSNSALFSEALLANLKRYKHTKNYRQLYEKAVFLLRVRDCLDKDINYHNKKLAESQTQHAYELIGNVEGRVLDKQQLLCIVKKAHNHLIIAGAGTGKTTTVVGKIKYLLKSGQCKPEDILVLSFTNASASEMSQRICKETGVKIAASTFHKLGLDIITNSDGIRPRISQINLHSFISAELQKLMCDSVYMKKLGSYILKNRVREKSEFDFNNEKEYRDYLQMNPPLTLKGESVKSYGEMDIANFLFQHGINYEYETDYKFDTRTKDYSQYHPDFYLPDYDIYIEYFGINRAGQVPSWFNGKGGKTPSETYREGMEWKRKLHKANNTRMIECFAYEKAEGTLTEEIGSRLEALKIPLKAIEADELWKMLDGEKDMLLEGISELFGTVINLLKSNNYTIDYFRMLAKASENSRDYLDFIDLLEPLYNSYDICLKQNGEIDFNDMINLAADYIASGKYTSPYSCVIVDEYQDISRARFRLLDTLRQSRDYDLFCVGDDWQSIYRFAGSDISYILDFSKYWGAATVSKIETTYRFTDSLIDISGRFIMRNPAQLKKSIKGKSDNASFSMAEINAYNEQYAVEFMIERLEELPRDKTVFFIGRYSFDADILKNSSKLECTYDNVSGVISVQYAKRSDLKMSFITAHKSKGLQADYVFIINNKNGKMGFPSKIQDDSVLELLLDNSEQYPDAEERRLFYVALTRAKTKVFLLTVKNKESAFVKELKCVYGKELNNERFICPLCGGKLVRHSGPYGEFFGCENYRTKNCKFKRNIKVSTRNP